MERLLAFSASSSQCVGGPIIHTMLWHNSQQSSGLGEEKAQKDVGFAVNETRRAEVGLRMAHNGTY